MKDTQQAGYVALGVVILCVILTFFLFPSGPHYAPLNKNSAAYQQNAQYEGGQ